MDGGIYLIQDNGELVEMTQQAYDSESLLQTLIARHPSLLAGDQMDSASPRRWLLVAREALLPAAGDGGGRWAVDHLFLDQEGVPTLVEVKRSCDTRLRREVVGQMLDYAANAVAHWPAERLRMLFEENCRYAGLESRQVMADFLGRETGAERFWQDVRANLRAGRIRMVFVADEIPPELARVVEFLNRQMNPAQVVAIEIRQYVGRGLKTLVPRLIGQRPGGQPSRPAGPREKRQWNMVTFFDDLLERRGLQEVAVAKRIVEWAEVEVSRLTWGKGTHCGSCKPVLHHDGRDHQLFAVWSSGALEIYFHWYTYKPPFDAEGKRRELLQRLNLLPGVELGGDVIAGLPTIPLAALLEQSSLAHFLDTFSWMAGEIRASGAQPEKRLFELPPGRAARTRRTERESSETGLGVGPPSWWRASRAEVYGV
ncbi:MAG TPA: hypothetical protein VGM19_15015 [Armatimonadota bacterium]|jgi:hypothetical protein